MRIAAIDLETTDLSAIMGTLLCGSFMPIVPPEYKKIYHTKSYGEIGDVKPYTEHMIYDEYNIKDPNPDRDLAVSIRDEIERYDCIVTWNGKMFDIPFLNARLLKHGERPVRPKFHMDLMYYAGYSANRIGSKKLVNVQKFLNLSVSKTDIDWDIWKLAQRGDDAALTQVIGHCEADVVVLAEVYWRLLPYVKNLHSAG